MRFKANRGGHAPGHLREWFAAYIDGGQTIDAELREEMVQHITRHKLQMRGKSLEVWLLGQLWNCEDVMPSDLRSGIKELLDLDVEPFTYGQAVRPLVQRQRDQN